LLTHAARKILATALDWLEPVVSVRAVIARSGAAAHNHYGGGKFMKIRPLQDRVIVERIAEEEKTKGGIIIPDTAKEKPQEGKVIAVGKGKVSDEGKVIPLTVKAGDKILFSKYAGSEIKLNGNEYLIMREDDILGIVEA
jgi:chaperonin GroES